MRAASQRDNFSDGEGSMSKTMCRTKDAEKRAKKQANPKFVCAKCGKKANKEKYLCRPEKLPG